MENLDESFTVNDNTFTERDCLNIIKMFNKFKKNKISKLHGYYSRDMKELNNPFEYMIEDYLKKVGDNSKMVEYWYRERWLDMRCHQDLNEYLLKTAGFKVINPNHGHIMYLSNETYEAGTVLFDKNVESVSIVYPKKGRIVRFNGKVFHYVPCPFDFMFGNDSVPTINKPRFVLLFNTWDEYIPDPNGPSPVCKTLVKPFFRPINEWKKVNVAQEIPLRNKDFSFRVKYMGDSKRRFGTNKIENFYVNRRFKEDGYNSRIIRYQIEKIPHVDKEDEPDLKDIYDPDI